MKKEIKSTIIAFYQGGTKLKASLPIDRVTVETEMNAARKEMRDAKLETVEETGDESYLFLSRNNLLFYNISVETPKSDLVIAPAGALAKV